MLSSILNYVLLALNLCVGSLAAPSNNGLPKFIEVVKRATCTPASLGDTTKDDTPAIKAAITSCGNGGIILIPAGKTYSIRTMLDFTGCVNCDFQLEGTLKASSDTTYWATQSAILSIKNIKTMKFRSLTGTGLIDGNGQNAYDIFAKDSTLSRPTLFYVTGGSGITVTGFTIKNPPGVFIAQKGAASNINYASLTMTSASKSTNVPKNTDGFDVGESTFTTLKSLYISNQDDCIAFKPGCNYVTVDGVTCAGTNHGLSVGSLAKTNLDIVKNVYVTNAKMINCSKAAGIKLYEGGSAHGTAQVSNVTYDGVTVDNCDYGVQIQSCYAATSAADCAANPSKATLSGIYFKNFSGKTSSKYAPVVSNLNCPSGGTCDVHFSGWTVTPPSGTAKNLCANNAASLGLTCSAGASG